MSLESGLRDLAATAPAFAADLPGLAVAASRRRRRRTTLRVLTSLAALALVGTGVSVLAPTGVDQVQPAPPTAPVATPSPSPVPSPSASSPAPVASPSASSSAPSSATRRVEVFFSTGDGQCDQVRGFPREVPAAAPLRPALEELFAGPTPAESPDAGSVPPAGLRSVRVVDDRVYVDLDASRFSGVYTTSCGGALFNAQLEATVRGIVPQARVVVALDGDPRAFVEAQQGFCPEPATLGDRCDASGFA